MELNVHIPLPMGRSVNISIISIPENVAVNGDIQFVNQRPLTDGTKVTYTSWRKYITRE